MQAGSNGHFGSQAQSLGQANDIVESISQVYIGEKAPAAPPGLQTQTHCVPFAAVRKITQHSNGKLFQGNPSSQFFRRSISTAVTNEQNFPVRFRLLQKTNNLAPRAIQMRTRVIGWKNQAEFRSVLPALDVARVHGTSPHQGSGYPGSQPLTCPEPGTSRNY